jgi:hypothetical protein
MTRGVVHYIALDLTDVWVWDGLTRLEWFLASEQFPTTGEEDGNDRTLRP